MIPETFSKGGAVLLRDKDALSDSYFNSLGRSSDCFHKVAGSIRTRCSELDMNEEERVVAAISMTLCELATAKHHAPPMECDMFSARLRASGPRDGFSDEQEEFEVDIRGNCVNALSRSAQFWSSYSGYLREVPQLCSTFQQENDIDNAKDLFRNISLNQELFLRMVVDREHANIIHSERWSAFFDHTAEITDQLSLLSRRIQTDTSSAVEELQRHGLETLHVLSQSSSEFRSQVKTDHLTQLDRIDSALAGLSAGHSRELQAIVPEFEAVLHGLLMHSSEVARQQQAAVLGELTTSVQDQWRLLYSEFSVMKEAISHLTTSTSSTALSLASQSHQTTQEIHQARALISDSAYHLSDVLNTLAGRTTDHIESLDVKVEELKDKLLPPAPKEEDQAWFSYDNISSERWWKGNLVWVLGFLIRGASLSAWIDSPFLKILEIIWIVAFWLLKRSLSTVTSFLVLCFSCRKYLHRILITSTSNWVPNDPERLAGQKQRQFLLSNDLFDPSSRKIAAPATTGAIGIDPQTNKVLGLSAALEPSNPTPRYFCF
ncbi:Nuclear fusion protein KAR5 [Lentinula edodes]|uniref:Nuclear fusion protein KAR5 n=1 Tax=Lentinula edodes TaxID=5353 RepID=A0A1Q3ECU7_LENED|nr:Nuclear fusion protein KAR5 [Lentinula edodes]